MKLYYQSNNGLLFNGDCLEVLKQIPDKSIDAIITDLPYGTTACKWDNVIPFEPMWKQLKRIRKERTPIVLFGSEPFSSKLRMSNIKEYKYDWYWIKDKPSNFLMGKKQPLRYVEQIIIFYKKQPVYNPQMEKRDENNKRKNNMDKNLLKCEIIGITEKTDKYQKRLLSGINDYIYPKNYQKFNNRTKGYHPTQKPLALMEYLIKTYTNEGDVILDFTAGSGTTLLAAEKLDRKWIGIELKPEYCEIVKKRLNKSPQK